MYIFLNSSRLTIPSQLSRYKSLVREIEGSGNYLTEARKKECVPEQNRPSNLAYAEIENQIWKFITDNESID